MFQIYSCYLYLEIVLQYVPIKLETIHACHRGSATRSCRENVYLLFFSLNLELSQQAIDPDCFSLSVFNLSMVVDCQWVEGYEPCLDKSILATNRGGGLPLFVLQSITCVQYARSEDFPCSCQMDCLLSFHGIAIISSDGLHIS